jgi:hypothetical protein
MAAEPVHQPDPAALALCGAALRHPSRKTMAKEPLEGRKK